MPAGDDRELALVAAISSTADDVLARIQIIVDQKIVDREFFSILDSTTPEEWKQGWFYRAKWNEDTQKWIWITYDVQSVIGKIIVTASGCLNEAEKTALRLAIKALDDACIVGGEVDDIRNLKQDVKNAWWACESGDATIDQALQRQLESDVADICSMSGVQQNVDIAQRIREATEKFKANLEKAQEHLKEQEKQKKETTS